MKTLIKPRSSYQAFKILSHASLIMTASPKNLCGADAGGEGMEVGALTPLGELV